MTTENEIREIHMILASQNRAIKTLTYTCYVLGFALIVLAFAVMK